MVAERVRGRVAVAVAGATGYAGLCLVHLLATHPGVRLAQLSSRSLAGRPLSAAFPLLDLEGSFVPAAAPDGLDVVFSCLPHGEGAPSVAAWLESGAIVIDMSADFRLKDPARYPALYGRAHPLPGLLGAAVPGLPELHAAELAEARLVAVPGCYATAAILALAPAAAAGLAGPEVVIDAKSGVSGAGRSPGLGVHFSEVNESAGAYAVIGHRHLPEIVQELAALSAGATPRITFVPHLLPMTRGILVTCYFDLQVPIERLREVYRDFYAGQPFTRLVDEPPPTKLVSHTNHCLVNVGAQGAKAVVTAAIDNLGKGASGQGVECFNLAFGFDRTEALGGPVQWP
ncbi:MAG: N-acetyl-gamma-glutamyl-phosphate reductase [Candidatus Dormibacteraceae bacterium]